MIIIDFDETITDTDTIKYISELPYVKNPQLLPKFSHFTSVYLNAYDSFKASHENTSITSINDEIAYQNQLKAVELTSINELEHHRIFKGITESDILNQSKKVPVKPGFKSFFNACAKRQIPIKILSINWSSILIKGVLASLGCSEDHYEVVVNDLCFENGSCTGTFDPSISVRTGYDKWNILQQLKTKLTPGSPLIYIGDSRTDLLSILDSDIGIIIEGGSLLKKLPWDIPVTPLSSFNGSGVYKGDWKEITRFVESYINNT